MFSSDKGNEFTVKNAHIKKVLVDKYKMNVFTMTGRTKGSIVERFNRTLKERIGKFSINYPMITHPDKANIYFEQYIGGQF